MMRHTFDLPFPVSKNRIHRADRRGGITTTREARAYVELVAMRAAQLGVRPVYGPFRVWVEAHFASARGDLGNVLDLLSDALNLCAWMDDKFAQGIYLERRSTSGEAFVRVTVEAERYATPAEVLVAKQKRSDSDTKRKRSRKRTRELKQLLALAMPCQCLNPACRKHKR